MAYRKPTRTEQREAMSKVEDDFHKLEKTGSGRTILGRVDARQSEQGPFRAVRSGPADHLLSPNTTTFTCEDRWSMRFELNKLGFALGLLSR